MKMPKPHIAVAAIVWAVCVGVYDIPMFNALVGGILIGVSIGLAEDALGIK